ncbi:MAG TPA: N-acyl homoserine lactonase family protein [Steroidobacteraceae bacterium]|nr:N-acyl homoserine lactonase family protein [Steroidobacteraceae bacterium]
MRASSRAFSGWWAALVVLAWGAMSAGAAAQTPAAAAAPGEIRLYTVNCGHLEFTDLSFFSDTGDYDGGKSGVIVAPCFVIRHPKGILVWDTGMSPHFPKGVNAAGVSGGIDVPVEKLLAQIGLKPGDVNYLAFSHLHSDHTGNANLFKSATWIMNKTELAWALAGGSGSPVDVSTFSEYKTARTHMIDGDYDVFGDGTVRILKTPGHTPGHQVLELKLQKAGTVILAGDLYHFRADRASRLVPLFNTDRADTLASFDRVERIAHNTHARVVIEHDPEDFKSMPRFPAYLD